MQRLLPPTVTAAQARLVARQSRGNPFWAGEIAASLESADSPVPPLARTLTDRLARSLSPDAREALAVVAAPGGSPSPTRWPCSGPLRIRPRHWMRRCWPGWSSRRRPDRAAHPLIGAAAVEALPPGRRQRLYQRLAEGAASPERYAHFAALAAGPGPDTRVAEALDAAAASARARAGNAEAAQFAAQAVRFTPEQDGEALVRRRIRAAELLFLAGDVRRSLEHLEVLELGDLTTADLERALPLLLDMTELVHGAAAATAIVIRAVDGAGPDPRRRALVLALASDVVYGIRDARREMAAEAVRNAEAAGPAADASLHRALINLLMANVSAGDGLDRALLDRAERIEARVPIARLHDTADLQRGLWSRYTEDLATARAALHRCIIRAREAGDDFALATFCAYLAAAEELAGDFTAAGAALADAAAAAAWHDWPRLPWSLAPRSELLIAGGDLDGAITLADQDLPDTPGTPAVARFIGALIRGRACSWRGDGPEAVRHYQRAASYADECGYADPGVRQGLDAALAEEYVSGGRIDDAQRISGWLRETGERLGRRALAGTANRIDALAAAQAGHLERPPGWPSGPSRRTSRHRCAPSWPAACWPWARSSGAAGPVRSPAARSAGRGIWPARWVTSRCWPGSSGSCRGWPPPGPGSSSPSPSGGWLSSSRPARPTARPPRSCSSASAPSKPMSPPFTASSAYAPGPSWPTGFPGHRPGRGPRVRSPTDTARSGAAGRDSDLGSATRCAAGHGSLAWIW